MQGLSPLHLLSRRIARRSASRRSLACPPAKHNPRRGFHRGADYNARACKPGSVVDGHLSRTHVAARLKPPPSGRPGRPCVPFHGVAPDRVYSAVMSPCCGRALISAFPPLRRRKVRSPPFPAKASGFRRKLRSLPCSSFPHESAGLSWGPHLISLLAEDRRGISLLHLSEGFPWRALPVILALWSPDFPHARPFGLCPRLSDPLAVLLYAKLVGVSI